MSQGPVLILYLLLLILPIAALASRRLPVRQTALMAAAWVAIFAIGYLVLSRL